MATRIYAPRELGPLRWRRISWSLVLLAVLFAAGSCEPLEHQVEPHRSRLSACQGCVPA